MNDDDNTHLAEVTITWEPQRRVYWLDDIVAIPEDMFEQVFGFEPKDGGYEVKLTLTNEYKAPVYDDRGLLLD